MEYRILGRTELLVSAVGLGCWQMARDGSWGTGGTDEESISTIHHAETLGINLLDTSASYGAGHMIAGEVGSISSLGVIQS